MSSFTTNSRSSPPANIDGIDASLSHDANDACLHCGLSLAEVAQGERFCCSGCAHVYQLMHDESLERYYILGGKGESQQGTEVRTQQIDDAWVIAAQGKIEETVGISRLDVDVQGLHCAACVWLLEQLFAKRPHTHLIRVNPALGSAQLFVEPGFSLSAYVSDVRRFGYSLGPALKKRRPESSGLLVRMGVCIAIAMNAMILSISVYAGLQTSPLKNLFDTLAFVLSTLSVLIGGSVFFRSAWAGLRLRVLHLDTPIALGILLAYGGSLWSFLQRDSVSAYFDTLNVFIALMLVGRYLQERVIERNRRFLLESSGVDGMLARKLTKSGAVEVVRCGTLLTGDQLMVGPSDLLPADMRFAQAVSCSLESISGESKPRTYQANTIVPAGACLLGDQARVGTLTGDFSASPLISLLGGSGRLDDSSRGATAFWQRFARVYVLVVLLVALGGFAVGLLRTHDFARALDTVTGILIVTCPCAFGIAAPMAYEIVQARLRQRGLFVRSDGLLDRVRSVRKVLFDKTGTLTTGQLWVSNPEIVQTLTPEERALLASMTARSHHPVSAAIARTLPKQQVHATLQNDPHEVAGVGLFLDRSDDLPAIAIRKDVDSGATVFEIDGQVRARFHLSEDLRHDAAKEVSALKAAGYEVWILSGDSQARAEALGVRVGIGADRVVGDASPEEKLAFLRSHDQHDTLMIGDGLNDSLVVGEAFCSGTPTIDRPLMASRSDFYFVTAGLAPIRLMLQGSQLLRQVIFRVLGIALVYNVFTIALAYAGLMTPLLCAIVMPVSSISTLLGTFFALRAAKWSETQSLHATADGEMHPLRVVVPL